jgi:long-subunit fatty acid transport protein
LNIASQIGNNFFIGANLNTHTLNFEQSSYLRETNNNTNSKIKNIGFENNLSVYGVGISAQIGAIAKIASNFRLGLSFDSPTWLQISEETSQYLESKYVYNGETLFNQIDPAIINVYEDYNLRTPAKLSVSAAYIFGQKGLISFDYSYKDFSTIKFSELNNSYSPYFSALNQTIQNNLKGASSFKAGGEYRIGQLSLRGGFHFEESPYIKPNIVEELIGFSGGLGYNFGRLNANIAYSRSEQNRNQQLYSIGLTDSAEIKSVYNTFVFSLGLDF